MEKAGPINQSQLCLPLGAGWSSMFQEGEGPLCSSLVPACSLPLASPPRLFRFDTFSFDCSFSHLTVDLQHQLRGLLYLDLLALSHIFFCFSSFFFIVKENSPFLPLPFNTQTRNAVSVPESCLTGTAMARRFASPTMLGLRH